MYSLNAPVPGTVAALASELARDLPAARARTRGEHTLCVKRLDDDAPYGHIEATAREALAGQPAFESRVTGIDYFAEAVTGTSPVVYLVVESPALRRLHERLVEYFDPVADIEGEAYTPHVTVARGGSLARAREVAGRDIDPVTWTVSDLQFWDAKRGQSVSQLSLPTR